jgi:ParB family chromosome partitioning protein
VAVWNRTDRDGCRLVPTRPLQGRHHHRPIWGVSYFADVDAFWALQNAAIAKRRDELAGQGWTVNVLDKGARFPAWQYDEACLQDGGEAFIEVRDNGEVEVHQGYRAYRVTQDPANEDSKNSDAEGGDAAARPELTKAAANYLALHRHAIVRAELLAHPSIVLRLAAAHMIAGSVERRAGPAARGQGR